MTAGPATGQERSPYQLRWERGGELCRDSEARLRSSVVTRLGFDPFGADPPKAGAESAGAESAGVASERAIVVGLSAQGGGYRVTLVFHDELGNVRSTRTLESASRDCRVILEATALAVALAIQSSIEQAAKSRVDTAGGASATDRDAEATAPPRQSSTTKPTSPSLVVPPPRRTAPPASSSATPLTARLEVALGVAAGTLPRPAPGLAVGGLIEIRKGIWASARMLHVPAVLADDSRFAVSLSTARFGVCLDPWKTGRFDLLSCAHGGVGLISTVVSELMPVDRAPAVFFGAGLGQWIYYRPTRGLALFAGEEITVPFDRYRLFVEGSDRTVFTVAPLTAYTFVGIALTTDPR